jgi:hypothetical protein
MGWIENLVGWRMWEWALLFGKRGGRKIGLERRSGSYHFYIGKLACTRASNWP